MADEIELRKHRCCFTGHRPEKIYDDQEIVKKHLEDTIKLAVAEGFMTFITGMSRGIDLWAGEIVIKLREQNPDLKLIAVVPLASFPNRWPEDWKRVYKEVLDGADLTKMVSINYDRSVFQRRNEWMVNHSAKVIAYFNGTSGGTKNTIEYALKSGVPVVNICDMKCVRK